MHVLEKTANEASELLQSRVEPPDFRTTWRQLAASKWVSAATLVAADTFSLALSLALAYLLRTSIWPEPLPGPGEVSSSIVLGMWWTIPVAIAILAYEGLYSRRQTFWQETSDILKACTLAFIVMLAIVSLGKFTNEISRAVLIIGYVFAVGFITMGRSIAKSLLGKIGLFAEPVLVVGAGVTGRLIAGTFFRDKFLGWRPIGFLDDDPVKQADGVQTSEGPLRVLGAFSQLEEIVERTGVQHVVIAAPSMDSENMVALANRAQQKAAMVTVIPDLFGIPVMGVEANYSFDDQMLSFKVRNNLANPVNRLLKRIFNSAVSAVALVALLPLLGLISLAIRLDAKGPALFKQARLGFRGKVFTCYKFRTMHCDAEERLQELLNSDESIRAEWEVHYKLKDDPRITRIGKLLRGTSLDELPQIINVLKGEMNLVGPRPRPLYEVDQKDPGGLFDVGQSVRPGMTGLWQVSGRSELNFLHRIRLDAWYARNWSPWLDVIIILRTIPALLRRKGAY